MAAVLQQYRTESGRTLLELVDESPLLLIFLRHFGCSFCRQTLDDVSKIRDEIEAQRDPARLCPSRDARAGQTLL